MNKTRNFLIILAVVLVFIISFFVLSLFKEKEPQMSHDFAAGTHRGEVISLHDNIGKSATALIFFDPSVDGSNVALSKFIQRRDKIDVIAVSVSDLSEADQKKLLPEGWDTLDKLCFDGTDAVPKYNIGNAPIIYFIDKDGYVRDVYVASIKDETIDKMIEKLK